MGILHIYCGDGKGKTTSAIGLAIRAVGSGMKVCFVQFMKSCPTSELAVFSRIPEITVMRSEKKYGFYKDMSETQKCELASYHDRMLEEAFEGDFDMIILDEFNWAYHYGLMDTQKAEKLISAGLENSEIILTGREPAKVFLEKAGYISRVNCEKHPFSEGVKARKGIEY